MLQGSAQIESQLRLVPDTRDGEKQSDLQYILKLSLAGVARMYYYRGIEANFQTVYSVQWIDEYKLPFTDMEQMKAESIWGKNCYNKPVRF